MTTMRPWLARPLRRFLGTSVMMIAGHSGIYRIHHLRPDLPPPAVDRVEVVMMEGSRTITNPAAVARIVAIVRSRDAEWERFPGSVCLLGTPRASFYQGAVERGTIVLGPRAIGVRSRHAFSSRVLSIQEAAELQRLLER